MDRLHLVSEVIDTSDTSDTTDTSDTRGSRSNWTKTGSDAKLVVTSSALLRK